MRWRPKTHNIVARKTFLPSYCDVFYFEFIYFRELTTHDSRLNHFDRILFRRMPQWIHRDWSHRVLTFMFDFTWHLNIVKHETLTYYLLGENALRGIMEPPDGQTEIYSGGVAIWYLNWLCLTGQAWSRLHVCECSRKNLFGIGTISRQYMAPSHDLTSIRMGLDGRSTSPRKELKRIILYRCYGLVRLE